MKLVTIILLVLSSCLSWAQLGSDVNDCMHSGITHTGDGPLSSFSAHDYDREVAGSSIPMCQHPCVKGATCDHNASVALGAPTKALTNPQSGEKPKSEEGTQ